MGRRRRETELDVLTDRASLASVEREWSELAASTALGPFGLPSFALPWWDRFGSGRPLVVTARRGGDLVGLLPLHERAYGRSPVAVHLVRWLGHGLGVVGGALLDPDLGDGDGDAVATAMWGALADAAAPCAALHLVEYHLDAPGLRALRLHDRWDTTVTLGSMVPVIDLAGRTVDDLLAGGPKRKFRWKLSAAERDLEADGIDWSIEFVDTTERFDAVLPEIDAVVDTAEAADAKLHFLAGEHRAVTLESLRSALERERLVVALLRFDGRAVALDVSVRVGDRLCGYIRRTDPTARPYSPGHLLLRAGAGDAIDRGVEVFDLGLGLDDYKRHWSNRLEDAAIVTAGRPGRGRAARAGIEAIDAAFDLRGRLGGAGRSGQSNA